MGAAEFHQKPAIDVGPLVAGAGNSPHALSSADLADFGAPLAGRSGQYYIPSRLTLPEARREWKEFDPDCPERAEVLVPCGIVP